MNRRLVESSWLREVLGDRGRGLRHGGGRGGSGQSHSGYLALQVQHVLGKAVKLALHLRPHAVDSHAHIVLLLFIKGSVDVIQLFPESIQHFLNGIQPVFHDDLPTPGLGKFARKSSNPETIRPELNLVVEDRELNSAS